MSGIIGMDFSKIEAQEVEFENVDFDLRLTLEDMPGVSGRQGSREGP